MGQGDGLIQADRAWVGPMWKVISLGDGYGKLLFGGSEQPLQAAQAKFI